jgi:hypothetical protein
MRLVQPKAVSAPRFATVSLQNLAEFRERSDVAKLLGVRCAAPLLHRRFDARTAFRMRAVPPKAVSALRSATVSVQNLAEFRERSDMAKLLGVRWRSTAFASAFRMRALRFECALCSRKRCLRFTPPPQSKSSQKFARIDLFFGG